MGKESILSPECLKDEERIEGDEFFVCHPSGNVLMCHVSRGVGGHSVICFEFCRLKMLRTFGLSLSSTNERCDRFLSTIFAKRVKGKHTFDSFWKV